MRITTIFVISFLGLLQPCAAQDHLIPEDNIYSFISENDEARGALLLKFHEGIRYFPPLAGTIFIPWMGTEWAVFIVRKPGSEDILPEPDTNLVGIVTTDTSREVHTSQKREYFISASVPDSSLWGGLSRSTDVKLARLRAIEVKHYWSRIEEKDALLIYDVFYKMVSKTTYPEPSSGVLDGSTFHFMAGFRTGKIDSPRIGSRPAKLAKISEWLRLFASSPEKDKQKYLQHIRSACKTFWK